MTQPSFVTCAKDDPERGQSRRLLAWPRSMMAAPGPKPRTSASVWLHTIPGLGGAVQRPATLKAVIDGQGSGNTCKLNDSQRQA